jgi:hypothetical protein
MADEVLGWLELTVESRPTLSTQNKSFWLLFTILSLVAGWLPLRWGVVETIVAFVVSWWVIYRTDLF